MEWTDNHPLRPVWESIAPHRCARWDVFEVFLDDMNPRPSRAHQLDRHDHTRPYCKANCYWVVVVPRFFALPFRVTELDAETVFQMRYSMRVAGITLKEMAAHLRLPYTHIRKAMNGETWTQAECYPWPIQTAS